MQLSQFRNRAVADWWRWQFKHPVIFRAPTEKIQAVDNQEQASNDDPKYTLKSHGWFGRCIRGGNASHASNSDCRAQ